MHVIEPPSAASMMVIAAHPDDIESWCAGTLACAIDSGATVRLLLVTSGDKGSNDPGATPQAVAAQREVEAQAAAQELGIAEVVFLREPDGEVENTLLLRRELVRWIRRWRPHVLFTHDPEHPFPPYISHRHRARCAGCRLSAGARQVDLCRAHSGGIGAACGAIRVAVCQCVCRLLRGYNHWI
jgi:LmbE family N-acetylglucosaminyl deacetylase